jgi:hypothetical protein
VLSTTSTGTSVNDAATRAAAFVLLNDPATVTITAPAGAS